MSIELPRDAEGRENDRGYEVGDKIVFDVVANEGYAVGAAARHPLNGATYRTTTSSTTSRASLRSTWRWLYQRRTDGRNRAEALSVLRWRC